ncbi:hypothetical protein M422DRAFT_90239, partial [Sphaerobolus stellatus SS14]
IWIDMRDSAQGPEGLIVDELGFWENKTALTSYYIMSWIMDVLLIHRCVTIWNWNFFVVGFMSLLLTTDIVMAILTLIAGTRGAIFADINFQLAYIVISMSTNIIYTILVAGRLLAYRKQTKALIGDEYAKLYASIAVIVIESSALYSCFGILYIITYALRSNIQNLVFLWILHLQAIGQLFIIMRMARG